MKKANIRLFKHYYNGIQFASNKAAFNNSKQAVVLNDLWKFYKVQIPPIDAFRFISDITKDGNIKFICAQIILQLKRGQRLSDAMGYWFNASTIAIISSGEEAGNLLESIFTAQMTSLKSKTAWKAFLGQAAYAVIMFMMVSLLIIFLYPRISDVMFSSGHTVKIPEETAMFVAMAKFLKFWFWFCVVGLNGLFGLILLMLRNYNGRFRKYIDKLPILGLYRDSIASSILRNLGILLTNDVTLFRATDILCMHASEYQRHHISLMRRNIMLGKKNMAEIMDTGLYNNVEIEQMRMMAEASGFEEAVQNLSELKDDIRNKVIMRLGNLIKMVLFFASISMLILTYRGIFAFSMAM